MKKTPLQYLLSGLRVVGVLFVLFFVTFPIFWLALTAFKNNRDAYSANLFFEPTLNNFTLLFDGNPYNFAPLITNSIIVSFATVAVGVPLAVMAAYAFSRYKFRGQNLLLVFVLSAQFLPATVVLLPFFIQFRELQLLDTRLGLIIMHLTISIPFAIWLVKGFIDALPIEIEQAALVDGCTELQVLRHVTLPLIMPGIVVATVFTFVGSWNEFLFAFIMTTSDRARPMMVGLLALNEIDGIPWEKLSAAGMLIMIPMFILALSIRKYFVSGLTMGAVK